MNNYARVFLRTGEEREILQGFPWVFDNEISHVKFFTDAGWKTASLADCAVADGSPVEVFTKSGQLLGTGIINRKSKITVRLVSRGRADEIFSDVKSFWEKRVRDAVNIRRLHYEENESCRLVFGEADLIPGLIVDRFVDTAGLCYLVVQFLSLISETFRREIVSALVQTCKPQGIYERSDAQVREKEGLQERSGWIYGGGDELIIINENGAYFYVDIAHGQKTGFFLDQRDNRKVAASYCHGKRVLDAFSHTGAFAIQAARAGAKEVQAVEISDDAAALVEKNAALNNVAEIVNVEKGDVFDVLKRYEAEGKKFDVVILDPPAFAKSAKAIQKAYGGYKEINLRAMRLLGEGGILISCSCSAFFDSNTFYDMLTHAAADVKRRVQILEKRGAGPDHPVLLGYGRSEYLKCAVARVF